MPFQKTQNHNHNLLVQYLPAVLKHIESGWLIEYYVIHPQQQCMVRQRMKLNRLKKRYSTAAEFKVAANEIVCQINTKLAGGWSPFFESENTRLYTRLTDVVEMFLKEKGKELRPSAMRSYGSWCRMFSAWCEDNFKDTFASLINKVIMIKYLDYLYYERNQSARTYNNSIKQGKVFFNWCVEKCYMKENPLIGISTKRTEEKKRILVPQETRTKISEYLSQHNPQFLLVCKLVFGSLIRPNEIRQIQIKQIMIKKRCIFISSDDAKNHHPRYAAISNDVIDDLIRMHVESLPDETYLFGDGLMPGKAPCPEAKMTKEWAKMRTALKLPKEMQLYSLRDTGINNMLKVGIDPLSVMQHADHHDLAMTTRYANHADENLIEKIREKAPTF